MSYGIDMRKVKWVIFIILTMAIGYSFYKINIAPLLGKLEEKFATIYVIDLTTPSITVFSYKSKISYCKSFSLEFNNFLSEQDVYKKDVSEINQLSQKSRAEIDSLISMNIPLEINIYQSHKLVYKNKIFLNRLLHNLGNNVTLYYSSWLGNDCYNFEKGISYTIEIINSIALKVDSKVKFNFVLQII